MFARVGAALERFAEASGIDWLSRRTPMLAAVLGWLVFAAWSALIGNIDNAAVRVAVSLPIAAPGWLLVFYAQHRSVFSFWEHTVGYALLALVIFVIAAAVVTPASADAWYTSALVEAIFGAVFAALTAGIGALVFEVEDTDVPEVPA